MGRLPASGTAGLIIERVKDPVTGEVTERFGIDLKYRDCDGQPQRYRERLDPDISVGAAKNRAKILSRSAAAGTLLATTRKQKTLAEAFTWYLTVWVPTNRPKSLHSKTTQSKALLKVLGSGLKLDDLSPFGLERFKAVRKNEVTAKKKPGTFDQDTVGAASINRALACIKHASGLWVENGWMRSATRDKIRKVKLVDEPAGRTRELTPAEEAKMIAILPVAMKPILRAGMLVGFRRANLALLRKSDINLETREITIGRTKNGKVLTAHINDSLAMVLAECMDGQDSEYVFLTNRKWKNAPHRRPYSPDSLSRAFGRAAKKAGIIGVTFHDSRHSWASRLRRKGVEIDVLQDMGGWRSLAMVRRYANVGKQALQQAASLLDGPTGAVSQYSGGSTPQQPEKGEETSNTIAFRPVAC